MQNIKNLFLDEEKRHLALAALGGLALVASFCNVRLPFDPAWIAVILCGTPILRGAVTGLVTKFDIKADVLVAMALVAAVCIGEIFAAGEVAFIMSLGALLEERTVRKAREGIQKLVDMTPRKARVLRNGQELIVPAEAVQVGDIVRVLPGESIPVDGIITLGRTAVDQSLMTGESLPVDKEAGNEVFSGTVNQLGSFDMRAVKVGEDSSLQRMIRLVESADASRTPIMRIMDTWATWIVVTAFITAIAAWLYTGEIIRGVTILVVFCPCALVLSTPTAIMAGIGNATRFGVLVSSGDALERLASINRVAFDKTGTLTRGKPQVTAVQPCSAIWDAPGLVALAATVEQRSEHPLGRAIMQYAREQKIQPQTLEESRVIPGQGITVLAGGTHCHGGTLQLMQESGISIEATVLKAAEEYRKNGATVVYFGSEAALAGFIVLADTLRPDADATIRQLHDLQISVTLLTGDTAEAAQSIARSAGIRDVRAELLPGDKVNIIRNELQQTAQDKVCMVGDGINDAPALRSAHVGIAMGNVGSDIAVDAADAVLVQDDIKCLPRLVALARKTGQTIRVNITMSMLLNFITVILAAVGWMGPVLGALAHNAGALLIVLNSVRLLNWKYAPLGNGAAYSNSPR